MHRPIDAIEAGRREAPRSLAPAGVDHRALFQGAPVPQAALSPEGGVLLAVNRAFCRAAGDGEDALLGRRLGSLLDARGAGDLAKALEALRSGAEEAAGIETSLRDGAPLLMLLRRAEGQDAVALALVDLRERRAAEERLMHRALYDSLTGLPNRDFFLARLEEALRRVGRRPGAVALLFLDLDRFKIVNDSLGHVAGDAVLAEVARRLREEVRGGDTVARRAGDEFTILCEDVAGERVPVLLAQRILDRLTAPITVEGCEIVLSASVGIALTRDPLESARDLLRDADLALYRAKERGRNRYELFHASLRAPALARLDEAEALRRALRRGELRVHFQPDVGLADGVVVGMEALVRWEHPARGLLPPGEFVALAEETGLIVEMGAWVLREACRQLARWPAPPFRDPLKVSVNLSARQLVAPGLERAIREALDETGLDPGRLVLEITESVLMEDVDGSLRLLGDLRALGVRVAIDDFGTGYSSLSYLRRFPVDVVKIDRSFVAGLGRDPAAEAIVGAVVNLSHALGLEVVAEGVESDEQLVALRGLRCDRGQGHLWSPPLPGDEARTWQAGLAQVGVRPTLVDLRPLLVERARELREETGRPVLLEVPSELAPVVADEGGVRTVLDQLLANAVAYSPEGRPVLISASTDRRRLRVSVSDFGIGMTVEQASRCFEQFWQAEPGGRGTGMGLFIVRSLVEAMGGHVGVRSTRGKGTTFSFTLPRSGARRGTAPAEPGVGERSMVSEFKRQLGIVARGRG